MKKEALKWLLNYVNAPKEVIDLADGDIDEKGFNTIKDAFTTSHNSIFVVKSKAHEDANVRAKVEAGMFAVNTKNIVEAGKTIGIEIDPADKKFDAILTEFTDGTVAANKKLVDDKGQSTDKAVLDLESRLNISTQSNTELKANLEKAGLQIDKHTKDFTDYKHGQIVGASKDKLFGGLKFGELDVKYADITKQGFRSSMEARFEFGVDEKGNSTHIDRTTGKPVPNPDKAGFSLTTQEVLDNELHAAGLKDMGGTPPKTTKTTVRGNGNGHNPDEAALAVHDANTQHIADQKAWSNGQEA